MQIKPDTDFLKICRQNNWKCTVQRLAVYDFLHGNMSHPDVDTVWQAVRCSLPTITRESVYRILNDFSEKGVIGRLDHIYTARYDSRADAHGHFICEKCQKIFDFDWPKGELIPYGLPTENIKHMELRIVGICSECSMAAEADKNLK